MAANVKVKVNDRSQLTESSTTLMLNKLHDKNPCILLLPKAWCSQEDNLIYWEAQDGICFCIVMIVHPHLNL